jgi:hypothetical protein
MTWALAYFPRPPLLLVPTENPLDHGSEYSKLKKTNLWTSISVVTLPFFPWCKPKSSRDNFNVQSHRLDGRGTTSWSIV